MEQVRGYARKSFLIVMSFMIFLLALHISGYYLLISPLLEQAVSPVIDSSGIMILGYYSLFFIFYALLCWIILNRSISNFIANAVASVKKGGSAPVRDRAAEKKKKEKADRRLFLHLLSTLQREGRLMDFFSEDLSRYEDAQIGAAVRNIHENCKKTLDKYVRPGSVVEEAEGDHIEIPEGFDRTTIKLTGNVAGEPPFTGILRHKGWQALKVEMPALSETENPFIIAPAEVEIP